jgi:uncharacterized protein
MNPPLQRSAIIATIALLPARTFFLLASQALFALLFRFWHHAQPWRDSTAWWTVYGTLADLGCLALIINLMHRQGLRFRDLVGSSTLGPFQILFRGLVYFLIVMPIFLAGFVLSSYAVYGDVRPHVDAALLGSRRLPIWAVVYSVTLWWPLWSATEELTYQVFFLDRLRRAFGGPAGAVAMVGFWWALQHSALPFLPDVRYVLWRFLGFLPGVLALMVIYLRTRQIRPLVFAHSMMDLAASASTLYWG